MTCWFVTDFPGVGWVRCDEEVEENDHYCSIHRRIMNEGYREN
jgi:hypothetical protein